MISRFAPSITGEAHPGTLLSALLVWLDARARGGSAILRLEDLDRVRGGADVGDAWRESIVAALAWLGLDWDAVVVQSERAAAHDAGLDALAAQDRLYPCTCSRADRAGGRRAPDGGWAYENVCRGKPLPAGGWRAATAAGVALRARLDDDRVALIDAGGMDLSQTPAVEMGDPIVRRKDGAVAYHLAVVVDDAAAGVTDVVRGKDLAASTATQVMLQRSLSLATPRYRHHFLLLERDRQSDKLSKHHGSMPWTSLREQYTGPALCGALAALAQITPAGAAAAPCTPQELVAGFDWRRVRTTDGVF